MVETKFSEQQRTRKNNYMNKNPLEKFTNKQLLEELGRRKVRKLIAVFNKDKLENGIVKISEKDFKEFNVGKITSMKLSKDIFCMIIDKDSFLAHFIKEVNFN